MKKIIDWVLGKPSWVIEMVGEDRFAAHEYGVTSVPTLVVEEDGQIVNRQVGFRTKEQIRGMLE